MSHTSYSGATWKKILACGESVEAALAARGIHLTMGGEPTFVPLAPNGEEWQTAALGPTKLAYARKFARELIRRAYPGAVVLETSGKHYPGEPLPRWALLVQRLADGRPLWRDPSRLRNDTAAGTHRRLLEGTQAGQGLAGLEDADVARELDELPREAGDPGEVAQEVQRRALAGEDRPQRTFEPTDRLTLHDRRTVGLGPRDAHGRIELRERLGGARDAGEHTGGARDEVGDGAIVVRQQRGAQVAQRTDVVGDRAWPTAV